MTTTLKRPIPLPEARHIAINIWEVLRPHTEIGKCKVAGSVRRKKPKCGDIEIVCVPLQVAMPGDLFSVKMVRCPQFIEAVKGLGEVVKGNPETGKQVQVKLYNALMLDLFIVEKGNFGLQYLIRTGPSNYSRRILTEFNKRGYHSFGAYPTRKRGNKLERLSFENEKEVYHFLGIPFVQPENRY